MKKSWSSAAQLPVRFPPLGWLQPLETVKCEAQRLKTRVVGCNGTEGWKKNYQANFNKCGRNKFWCQWRISGKGRRRAWQCDKSTAVSSASPFLCPTFSNRGKVGESNLRVDNNRFVISLHVFFISTYLWRVQFLFFLFSLPFKFYLNEK